jgi:flagellar protein FlaJ
VLKVPVLVLVTGLVFGAIGVAIGFGTLIVVPYSRSASREREINMLLPDAVSYMYALSVGGLNQVEILEAMAVAEDTYGEVSREFQSIVQETEYFDTDYRTAIRHQAHETPSDELGQFLTDMLSIINSGGDMPQFLEDKKERHLRTAKLQQETILDTLELLGEMYLTLALFPLLLIVVLVIMTLLGRANQLMLFATVYGLIPLTGVAFLILVSTMKWDEPSDGYLSLDDDAEDLSAARESRTSLFNRGFIEQFAGEGRLFERIKRREGTHQTVELLTKPHLFFRDHPGYTLAITVPTTIMVVLSAIFFDAAPTTWEALVAAPVWGTFLYVYLPVYVIGLPYAIFYIWNIRSREAVLHNLSDNLRKLSSANDTGLNLLDSVRLVGETSSGRLAREFDAMYAKVKYGMSLKEALVAFNNKYHLPRLARTVRLISKAQEASNHITAVIRTAAQASENQDEIDGERVSRTRVQVAVIVMTYLTLLAVMAILKTQFIDVMAGLNAETTGSGAFGAGMNDQQLSLLFFHAITAQAFLSGVISGYVRKGKLAAGLPYVLVLMTVALAVWAVVA